MRDYDKEAKDTGDRKYAYKFDELMMTYMMRTFLRFRPKGKVLEMGCYHGSFTEILSSHFSDVTVIEASSDCISAAQNRVGQKVRFLHLLFEDYETSSEYDSIFLIHTLEHLDDPVGTLKKIHGWLTPGGKLFVACPNANAPSRQIAVKMGLISHNSAVTPAEREHGHRQTYSLDTLERDIRLAELHVIARGGVFFKPLANFQFDALMGTEILSDAYMEGCYELGMIYPDLCSSIYLICGKVAS